MRTPSRGVGPWARFVALALMSAIVLAACAEAAPSIVPTTSRPTPVITPDPHLTEPTTADDVYRGLGASGLRITANNATAGGDDSALVKRINATYLGWPLNVSQYRTTSALAKATDWKAGQKPGQGEAPVAIAAANILITWGPQTGERPVPPDERQMQGLKDLLSAMDRLLSPIRARTIVAVSVPGLILGPTAAPTASADATTADGGATPKP
jgi:hypothetical protein